MPRGVGAIDDLNENPKKDVHNLSIEKLMAIYLFIYERNSDEFAKQNTCS